MTWPPPGCAGGPAGYSSRPPRGRQAGDPDDLDEYRAAMVAERRLVYVLTPERVYPSAR